jgi:hypothetical protein
MALREIKEASELTEDDEDQLVEICCGWFPDERIDWERYLLTLEETLNWDLGTDWRSSAIIRIQRVVREHRREVEHE